MFTGLGKGRQKTVEKYKIKEQEGEKRNCIENKKRGEKN